MCGGPYEADPAGPLVTSQPKPSNERHDPDHLKPKYFNPDSVLQKSGHGSYVNLPNGEVYLAHLCARPFVPELRCTLGRETALQKMTWTPDGWLRMADGSNLAKEYVPEPTLPAYPLPQPPAVDDFDGGTLRKEYYAPRIMPQRFVDLTARPGWLRIRGQESLTSLNKVSLLARKLTSVQARVTTKMEFHPETYQHTAGLVLYYDNMNFAYLYKYSSETLGSAALCLEQLENGERRVLLDTRTPVQDGRLWLRLCIQGRASQFYWSTDGNQYQPIGPVFDTTKYSDEFWQIRQNSPAPWWALPAPTESSGKNAPTLTFLNTLPMIQRLWNDGSDTTHRVQTARMTIQSHPGFFYLLDF